MRVLRAAAAIGLAVALSATPTAIVSACSCAGGPLEGAVAEATVAIVGSPMGIRATGRDDMGTERVVTTWAIEYSRDPIDAGRVEIESWTDSGANCGISFADGERWLVLAYAMDGRTLETNGCMQNRRLDGSDPEAEAVVAEMVTEPPGDEGSSTDAGLDIPTPILALGAVLILVGAVSLLAFRRTPAG
jgi:hypothetical protein